MAVAVDPPSRLTTTVGTEGTVTVVVLHGEADLFTVPILSDTFSRVLSAHEGDVVVDLADAAFIDTSTARTFAVFRQLLHRRGHELSFRSPSRMAIRVLDLFELAELIEAPPPATRRPTGLSDLITRARCAPEPSKEGSTQWVSEQA
ncbi:MAG: hypothetical protein QOJ09_566 [Actinomycetota bacterium]|jgi:anti-anti-sigma factor|nr:hypothetical protein [Actinomycetota bacterium]